MRRCAARPVLLAALAILALAALSLALAHTLRYDPQGWLRWGREIALGRGDFSTTNYPSWKPLPVLPAIPLALTGAAAPWLWLLATRAAGLAAMAFVGMLAWRRAGMAGAIAAAALMALAPGWWPTLLGGGIEPVVIALGCAAVAAHQRGRPGVALTLLALMALGREEAGLLVVGYAVATRHASTTVPVGAALAVAAIAAAWFGGDWLGSGDALHGASLAHGAPPETPLSRFNETEALVGVVVLPPMTWLVVGGLSNARARHDRTALGIAVAGLAWAAVDLLLRLRGYPVPARFLLPAIAALAPVAGLGTAAPASDDAR